MLNDPWLKLLMQLLYGGVTAVVSKFLLLVHVGRIIKCYYVTEFYKCYMQLLL